MKEKNVIVGEEQYILTRALDELYIALFNLDAITPDMFHEKDMVTEAAHYFMFAKMLLTKELSYAENGILWDTDYSLQIYEKIKSILQNIKIHKRCNWVESAIEKVEILFGVLRK